MNQLRQLVNFIFELGQLRRLRHIGWRLANVDQPESVAAHSLRAAQIGYFLAQLEGYEFPDEVVRLVVFHDMGECRIGDIDKLSNRYIEADEERAVSDQSELLGSLGDGLLKGWREFEYCDSEAGIIAKDADYLEQAAMAKEHIELGHKAAQRWIDNIEKRLKTDSAKKLLVVLVETESTDWWSDLKRFGG